MTNTGQTAGPVIAVDANGADLGVAVVVRGVNIALANGTRVRIFGPEAEVRAHLTDPSGLAEVVDAPAAISNSDEPAAAVRNQRDASVVLGAKAVGAGECSALVSAGPTGAMLAASLFNMKRIRGVARPGLAALVPDARGGVTVLLDAGANVDVPAEMLVQFAALGAEFCKWVLDVERPRVGLLSIGEEAGKGTQRVVDAGKMMSDPAVASHYEFIGNVEGRDIPTDRVDVVVTDGFTGNVALKTLEGTARALMLGIKGALESSKVALLGGLLAKRQLRRLAADIDPNTHGGALLLGVRGVAVVAHGSSTANGVAAAIALARRSVEGNMVSHLSDAIGALRELQSDGKSSAGDGHDPASASTVTVGANDDA